MIILDDTSKLLLAQTIAREARRSSSSPPAKPKPAAVNSKFASAKKSHQVVVRWLKERGVNPRDLIIQQWPLSASGRRHQILIKCEDKVWGLLKLLVGTNGTVTVLRNNIHAVKDRLHVRAQDIVEPLCTDVPMTAPEPQRGLEPFSVGAVGEP
jgi:hypothetical protein